MTRKISDDQSDTGQYIPGRCNIGKKEIAMRRDAAITSTLLTVILMILFQMYPVNRLWRLTIFIPAVSAVIGFIQWYFRFCVAFGLKGVFNFGPLGKTFTVELDENIRKDRSTAVRRIIIGTLIAATITIIYFLLPV
ncbi:MAG: hypothetical protein WCE64_16925 [Bacteroidales bacterium]